MMEKRDFLRHAGALGALGLGGMAASAPALAATSAKAPQLLHITGAIGRSNRGAFDAGRDILFGKQKINFERALSLDFTALAKLPQQTIRPTLEYDSKVHSLQGPLLTDVLALAGVKADAALQVQMRAIDGYVVNSSLQQVKERKQIVALMMDGQAMSLGGLGPLWAVYDADRVPEFSSRPVNERFIFCPWGLYHINLLAQ
ncbi:molybdopterin-dependent oxidoreductase [Massilia sp. W12]|uniref:molybdopterin-dependent oxidoreductase n=1 Tax=Massilia sp. W12 TaxID=3126507 RepID=UPI0030D55BF2